MVFPVQSIWFAPEPGTCYHSDAMRGPVKITTPFPSVMETAKRLGVSKHDAIILSALAERSQRTGEFVMPGLGRLVRAKRKARLGRNPATGAKMGIPAKTVAKLRVETAKNASSPPKKR